MNTEREKQQGFLNNQDEMSSHDAMNKATTNARAQGGWHDRQEESY